MKHVILDTNALSMVLTDDQRLPRAARHAIGRSTRASVSAITFYEIGQKVRLGKWDEMAKFAPDLVSITLSAGFDLIPLSPDAAIEASLIEWSHRDPFDRMIAAVALAEGASLISSDAEFDQVNQLTRVWA